MKLNHLLTAFSLLFCTLAKSQTTSESFSFTSATEKQKVWVKRNSLINIYPNPSYNGSVSVSSKSEKVLHFYIFDLEGTLIYQAVLKDKEKKLVNSWNKGTYMYNVFLNDESIEEGKLTVK
jgi:hypothetical protein